MSIKTVLKMGDPALLKRSQEVIDFNTSELDELIQDMKDTMLHMNGAGGCQKFVQHILNTYRK